jgi:hypothetical protein
MLICFTDRVPLTPAPDGRYQCPECGKVHSRRYWKRHQPDADLRAAASRRHRRKKKRPPPPPPVDITVIGPQYQAGIREIMDRVLAATRDRELVVEQIEALVADRRDGDQGNTRVDEFDAKVLDGASAMILEVLVTQELATLFGVEPYARRRLLRNLIDRMIPPRQPRTVPVPPR